MMPRKPGDLSQGRNSWLVNPNDKSVPPIPLPSKPDTGTPNPVDSQKQQDVTDYILSKNKMLNRNPKPAPPTKYIGTTNYLEEVKPHVRPDWLYKKT